MDITAKVFQQDRKSRKGRVVQEAGFVVYNPTTGKNLDNRVFTTHEEADAAIPGILARVAGQIEINAQREAATEAVLTAAATAESRDRGAYRSVHNSLYGEGRVYRTQPGATQYDDGSGHYSVQIWDND